jgi:hypothetical protein
MRAMRRKRHGLPALAPAEQDDLDAAQRADQNGAPL